MLTEKEIIDIANNYANSNRTEYYSLQLLLVKKSAFLDGYYDVSFKVMNEMGNEIEGPILVAISEQNGKIFSMEELITQEKYSSKVKISNEPLSRSNCFNTFPCGRPY